MILRSVIGELAYFHLKKNFFRMLLETCSLTYVLQISKPLF